MDSKRLNMFDELEKINIRPEPFGSYTASDLWTDEHTSSQMLLYHLKEDVDMSSRNVAFIDRSVKWIVSRFNVGKDTSIVDFGCGPGLYTTRLARHQATVTGIDFSDRSINHAMEVSARERLTITYVKQNYLDFETEERFDLVLMIMCDFCAISPAQRKRLLGIFSTILKPGGLILLDVYSEKAFHQREEMTTYEMNLLDGFWAPGKYYGFQNTFKYHDEKVVLDKYTIVEPERTRTVYNWLQYFTPEALEAEFRENGFCFEVLHSDVAGGPYDPGASEFAVIAKRMKNHPNRSPAKHPWSPILGLYPASVERGC